MPKNNPLEGGAGGGVHAILLFVFQTFVDFATFCRHLSFVLFFSHTCQSSIVRDCHGSNLHQEVFLIFVLWHVSKHFSDQNEWEMGLFFSCFTVMNIFGFGIQQLNISYEQQCNLRGR